MLTLCWRYCPGGALLIMVSGVVAQAGVANGCQRQTTSLEPGQCFLPYRCVKVLFALFYKLLCSCLPGGGWRFENSRIIFRKHGIWRIKDQ